VHTLSFDFLSFKSKQFKFLVSTGSQTWLFITYAEWELLYRLLNDDVGIEDYIAWNNRRTDECWIGKDKDRSGRPRSYYPGIDQEGVKKNNENVCQYRRYASPHWNQAPLEYNSTLLQLQQLVRYVRILKDSRKNHQIRNSADTCTWYIQYPSILPWKE
jgi:hypothetical protein